jgi:hypothetical protein
MKNLAPHHLAPHQRQRGWKSMTVKSLAAFLAISCAANGKAPDHQHPNQANTQSEPTHAVTVAEGGATSGGGELVADAHNPWFLQNTPVVKYCITSSSEFEWDDDHWTKIDAAFQSAVAYWNEQIKLAEPYQKSRLPDGSKLSLGGQEFVHIGCNDEMVDLTLSLGVLNDEQLAAIKDPARFAAITVRTSYDPEDLRGRGFIYIAPDRGPRAFKGLNLVDDAWTQGDHNNLLRLTFIHELGHIFGLQHRDHDSLNLMSSKFVETILQRDNYRAYLNVDKPDGLLQNYKDPQSMMNAGFITCFMKGLPPSPIVTFFNANLEAGRCLRFDPFKGDREPYTTFGFQIWQSSETGADIKHLGFVGAERFDDAKMKVSNHIVSDLYVTHRQKVLPLTISRPQTLSVLESSVFKFSGSLIQWYGDNKQTLSLLSIEPNRIKITAAVGNEMHEDIFGIYAFMQKKMKP